MRARLHFLFAAGLTLLGPLGTPLARAEPEVDRYAGEAYAEDGRLAYREQHEVVSDEGALLRSRTRYLDATGKEIARLDSDYSSSPHAPTYTFLDLRAHSQESARARGRTLLLTHDDEQKSLRVAGDDPLVLGQGMHQFIRSNLERLSRQTVTVRFGMPGRLSVIAFRIRPMGVSKVGVLRLRIEADDWVLRFLAPHLEVNYDLATRRLLSYRGLSNLLDAEGKSQSVFIRYRYGDSS